MDNSKLIKALNENVDTNILNVNVSRPNQELIVLRGIPGAGKSTKTKTLIGNGISHSTDDLIEKAGDYNEFFATMIATKNFSPLSKMHAQNVMNAITSMKSGISPVIIDNTNIKMNEPKQIVMSALKMGFSDDNIKFIDIGTAGLEAEVLAKRNTHGVPLEKIKQMIASHTGQGEMTLKKVVNSKDIYNENASNKNKKFASVVLDDTSRDKLLKAVGHHLPLGWDVIAHHMTINFGKGLGNARSLQKGDKVRLEAVSRGISDMAFAVGVNSLDIKSDNEKPHITIGVNKIGGGKPVMSNDIEKWVKLEPHINLTGVVTEQSL